MGMAWCIAPDHASAADAVEGGGVTHLFPPPAAPAEIIVDSFAGGGGASTGIEMALGRSPDVAINHDPVAIAMHTQNHPDTRHFCRSIYTVSPMEATQGRPVGLLWASPDCRHFSKAKGGKPVSAGVRDLAWVVVEWARRARPRVIILENVEEFQTWGPLRRDGRPCPDRRGQTFTLWAEKLRRLGYRLEWRELRACDYGAPTIRRRLFVIARRDGRPIVWPEPTHGAPDSPEVQAGQRRPWRTAAEIIDWSLPCPSIFLTPEEARAHGVRRPLAEATLRRVARGVVRYVLDSPRPFIIPVTHGGDARCWDSDEPLRTITTARRGEMMVVAPSLVQTGYGERPGQAPRVPGLDKSLGTVVAGGQKHAFVAAFLARHYGNGGQWAACDEPLTTATTRARMALVTVHFDGVPYVITDIGIRMLSPRELFRAQGFPDSYQIDLTVDGRPLSKADQVRCAGNSVCPPLAAALVAANVPEMAAEVSAAREVAS